jgi:hypothetical protein
MAMRLKSFSQQNMRSIVVSVEEGPSSPDFGELIELQFVASQFMAMNRFQGGSP